MRRMTGAAAFVVSSCFLLLPIDPCSSVPVINLNIKPSFLANVLAEEEQQKQQTKEKHEKNIALDLSGQYECLIMGQEEDALLHRKRSQNQPSFYVGATYDFGIRMILDSLTVRLQWQRRGEQQQRQKGRQQPMQMMNLNLRKNISQPKGPVSAVLQWTKEQFISLEVGVRSDRRAHLLTKVAPHNRLNVLYHAHINNNKDGQETTTKTAELPLNKSDFWLPDLTMSLNGRLESANQVTVNNKCSIKLIWSRSFAGWYAAEEDSTTTVRLQTVFRHGPHHGTTLTLQGVLEDAKETAHLTLSHEQHVCHQ